MNAQVVTFLAACMLPTVLSEGSTVGWCYDLPSCNYSTWPKIAALHCNGTSQSPVNIVTANVKPNASLTAFTFAGFDDNSTILQIENSDGKTVKVTLDDAQMNVSGGGLPGVYKSLQLHLHWGNGSSALGSEHTVDGKQYPMELHIVNLRSNFENVSEALEDSEGLAVLGFFIEATNDTGKPGGWKTLTSFLPNITSKGSVQDIMNEITLNSLLEGVDLTKYYRYMGSLTTPSCNEAVVWTVFKDPIRVSQDLINLFSTSLYMNTMNSSLITNNFRGVQALNSRVITTQPKVTTTQPSVSSASTRCQALSVTAAILFCALYWL